jgi:hypothetical protein
MQVTLVVSEPYEGKAMKKSSVFEWHEQFKESLHIEITNEDHAHNFDMNGVGYF